MIFWRNRTRVTKRTIKERRQALVTDDKISLIAAHHCHTHHDFVFDDAAQIINRLTNWISQLIVFEAWLSINCYLT